MLGQESADGNILAPRGESLDDNSNARPMLAIVPLFCTSSPRFTHASSRKRNYVPCASCASIPHGRFAEVVALIIDLQGRKTPCCCARGRTHFVHMRWNVVKGLLDWNAYLCPFVDHILSIYATWLMHETSQKCRCTTGKIFSCFTEGETNNKIKNFFENNVSNLGDA